MLLKVSKIVNKFINSLIMKKEEKVFELIQNNLNDSSFILSERQIEGINDSIEYHEEIINNRVAIDQEDLTKAVVKL